MKEHPDPQKLLPLPAATFHILMSVADEDRHGYAIIQDVAARTRGELKLSAGTLYRSIQRMLEQGLLMETRDGRRRRTMTNDAATIALRHSGLRWRGRKRAGSRNW